MSVDTELEDIDLSQLYSDNESVVKYSKEYALAQSDQLTFAQGLIETVNALEMHLRFTKDMSHKKALQEIHAKVLREFYANTKIKPTIVQKRLCLWCGALVVGIMTHAEYKKCQECLKIFIDCEDCLNHTAPYIPSLPAKCLKCHGCETFNIHKTKAICRPRVLKLSKHVGDIDLGDSIINH